MKYGIGIGVNFPKKASGVAVETVPAAFTVGQWTLADSPSAGGDKLAVDLTTLPSDGGSAITALEFRRDGGAASTLSGLGTGSRLITVLASTAADIQLRAVNAIGSGPWSDTKTATPTVASGFTIVSSTPADNATGVLNTINPQITFSAPVVAGTGLITLRQNNGGWSDLETFDMATAVVLGTDAAGAAAGQVFFMGSTIQINPSTILVEGRQYAIHIAATAIDDTLGNSFAGIADDTTLSFTTAAAPQVARFGDSTNNASGTGSFDTNLYTGSPPANGTYGNFTVTAGVISCNGSQTVGTYDVGGYPVEVVAGLKAVANQTEHNALTNGTDNNKTILTREGANVLWDNTASGLGRRTAFGASHVMLGDGPPVRNNMWNTSYDARKHYTRHFHAAMTGLVCDNLRIAPGATQDVVTMTAVSGGAITATGNIEYRNCLLVASRPDPNGDYTGGQATFPGNIGYYGNAAVVGTRLYDNVVIGGERGYRVNGLGYVEDIGNISYLSYEDALTLSVAGCPTLTGGCLLGVGLARPSDTGNPHGDFMQILPGATPANHVVEAVAGFAGDNRGRTFNQTFFLSNSTNGYRAWLRDLIVVDDPIYSMTVENTVGSIIEHCSWAPTPYTTLPDNINGTRFGSAAPVSGTNIFRNNIMKAGGTVDASVTQTNNLDTDGYTAGNWVSTYADWTVGGEQYPTLQQIFTAMVPDTAGKGHRVTFSGPKNSDFVIDGGLTAPTLSGFTVTSTVAATVTAEIDTTLALNPIFWAVVPTGQSVTTPRDIKHRKVANGILWGFTSVTPGGEANVVLNCAGAGLTAATTYDIVAMQENGWTAVSTVARVTFTAT